jgi:hypothetical protein
MMESNPGVANFPRWNGPAAQQNQNFGALKPVPMVIDYPTQLDTYDVFIASLNPMWWSKIMSGAYASTPDTGMYPVRPFDVDGSPRLLQYSLHVTRYFAMTMEFLFTYMQMPTEVWNGAFSQLNYTSLLEMIRGFFSTATASVMDPVVADYGFSLGLAHCRITGCSPSKDMYGNTLYDYPNVPRVGFLAPMDNVGTELVTCTPCVLPDVWVQINQKIKTSAYMPLLSAQKELTGIPMPAGQVTPLGVGAYSSPILITSQARAVGLETIPEFNSDSLFNAKLTWNIYTSDLYLLDGTVYATSTPQSTWVIAQKSVLPDFTILALLLPGLLTSKSTWMPYMNIDGDRLVVGVTAANGAANLTQVMSGRAISGTAMWLINGSYVMPNTVVMSGGSNTVSRMVRRPGAMGNGSSSLQPAGSGEMDATLTVEDV